MAWTIICKPEGRNGAAAPEALAAAEPGEAVQGENQGGMVIYLADGSSRHEVSRVGFVRRNSKNPKVKFEDQLDKELAKAYKSAEMLNAAAEGKGVLQ
jgi:hypothetical protein